MLLRVVVFSVLSVTGRDAVAALVPTDAGSLFDTSVSVVFVAAPLGRAEVAIVTFPVLHAVTLALSALSVVSVALSPPPMLLPPPLPMVLLVEDTSDSADAVCDESLKRVPTPPLRAAEKHVMSTR